MAEQAHLEMAKLTEITLATADADAKAASPPKEVTVQFNPESLKVAYANTVGKTDATGSSAMQFISASSTKLDVELWFDATVHEEFDDVRKVTADVHYFVTPSRDTSKGEAKFIIPAARFSWGSFSFEGVVTTLNETLEFFSADGRPLRSRITLSMAAQDIQFKIEELTKTNRGQGGDVGQTPQTPVSEGQSVQDIAAASGQPGAWKDLAAENGIENPRSPGVGTLLAAARTSNGSVGASISVDGVGSLSFGTGT